jgi:hypothetical protein
MAKPLLKEMQLLFLALKGQVKSKLKKQFALSGREMVLSLCFNRGVAAGLN